MIQDLSRNRRKENNSMSEKESTPCDHPLELLSDKIKRQGVVVINDVSSLPSNGVPYVSPHLVISINHAGWVKAEYDMVPVVFEEHDLAVVYPNHILVSHEASDDYKATLIVVSDDYFKENRAQTDLSYQIAIQNSPAIRMTDEQYDIVVHLCHILQVITTHQGSRHGELVAKTMALLSDMIRAFRADNGEMSLNEDSHELHIFKRFYDDLLLHYQESHEVCYYADLQCLSSKYFSTMIKEATGSGPIEWIARVLCQKAQVLLQSRKDMTIQNIAYQLGFSDQAVFSRFFKKHTGHTPTEYRQHEM